MTVSAELERWLEQERSQGSFPSWQALVAERGQVLWEGVGGFATLEPVPEPATPSTLYDLASLTKPLITALLTLRLAEEGVLALDMPVSRAFAEMCRSPLDRITVLDLLTHRAGFAPWRALALECRPPLQRFARAVLALPLDYPPGSAVRYSDLGFLVLGALLERVTETAFAELATRHALGAVGGPGEDLAFPPEPSDAGRTAATERGNEFERKLAGAAPGEPRFRRELIRGAVHDGNAFALGGVSPHAGLFGTARGVLRLAAAWLGPGEVPGPAARALARMNQTPFASSHRSAAFELASGEGTAASGVLPPDAMGHTGFTGTSVWLEPGRERCYILLTNRVHPEVREQNMNAVRRRFHALAAGL